MNITSASHPGYISFIGNTFSYLFGILVLAIGIVNLFWGNDPGYGIFIFLLAFVFFPPATRLFKKMTGFSISWWMKIIVALMIIVTALGVGELFDKLEMMRTDLHV